MDKHDARTLSNDALEQLRKQAVRLSRRGETNTAIAEILGVNRRTVGLWRQRYAAAGAAVVLDAQVPDPTPRLVQPQISPEAAAPWVTPNCRRIALPLATAASSPSMTVFLPVKMFSSSSSMAPMRTWT